MLSPRHYSLEKGRKKLQASSRDTYGKQKEATMRKSRVKPGTRMPMRKEKERRSRWWLEMKSRRMKQKLLTRLFKRQRV